MRQMADHAKNAIMIGRGHHLHITAQLRPEIGQNLDRRRTGSANPGKDTPGINQKQHGEVKLGGGPSVSVGRENHPVLVERIRKVAKRAKIGYQVEAFSVCGGTDAMAIHVANGGIPTALVSVPNRYMHSTVETINLKDLEQTAALLAAVAGDLGEGEMFRVEV